MPQIEVTFTLWLAAIFPLIIILVLLVGFRWKAVTAAPLGYFIAVLTAIVFFGASNRLIALQTIKGVWDAVFILYVIIPALLLYQISKEAGAFQALKKGIEAYTPNDLLHVLAFGWVFASFLQGITGFGAPVAVVAPLLVAIGVKPLWAVALPLMGHSWANTFGTLAVAWNGLTLVTDMGNPSETATIAAFMLFVANLLSGFSISWFFGKLDGVKEALPAIIIISSIHGLGQFLIVQFAPELAAFLPTTVAIGAVLLLGKSNWYNKPTKIKHSEVMKEGELSKQGKKTASIDDDVVGISDTDMSLFTALSPYFILIGLIVSVLLISPINQVLSAFEVGLSFPELQTDKGVITQAQDAYSAFAPLTHAGTFLMISAVFAYIIFKNKGEIKEGRIDEIIINTVETSIPSAVALFALVPLAKVMEGSGQTLELALGVSQVAIGNAYAFVAPLVGAVGTFMTSSNMSSNILFGPLQERTAISLGIAESAILAAQTAGAAIANSIAPGNVLLGTGAVGISGKTGSVIRKTIIYMIIGVVLMGIITFLSLNLIGGNN